jgi:ketosteroid isomerase-like protein
MQRLLMCASLAAALAAFAAPAFSLEPGDIEQLEQQRFGALTHDDYDTLGKLLADDLVYTHSTARVDTKQSYIDSLKSGAVKYVDVERTDTRIRVYGSAAVVAGQAIVHVKLNGEPREARIRYTNVWVERPGGWQMVAWEATPIPAK